MIDMEQTVYDILTTTLTGMKWSVGFPQDFARWATVWAASSRRITLCAVDLLRR